MAVIITCPVVSKQQLNERYCLIGVHAPQLVSEVQPGQFINVQIPTGGHDPLLKRPFSVHKVDRVAGVLYILFKIIGKGTDILAKIEPRTMLQIMGPLGNGFRLREAEEILLIGGGIGAAPLYQLARSLTELGSRVTLLLGLTDWQDLVLAEVLGEFSPRTIVLKDLPAQLQATEQQGLVTDLLAEELKNWRYTQVYVCGPKPMLAAIQKMLGERKSIAQLSMEEKMGCGIGLCFSCTCKVKDETKADNWSNERVCTHGPVFMGDEVIFDD